MPYGTIKVDTVTFTNAGIDKSVTISGLVQNPIFSGNVTVTGTLSGVTVTGTTANFTSGNFTNISGGTHTITSGVFAAGSAASPSITFTGDLNTGIYSPGADQVAISTGGSGRLFVNGAGSVGIGTASPAAPFDCSIGDRGLQVSAVTASHVQLTGTQGSTGSNLRPMRLAAQTLSFNTGASTGTSYTERVFIDTNGNIGIGTPNATANIHVLSSSGTEVRVACSIVDSHLNFWEGNGVSGNADTARLGVGKNNTALIYTNTTGTARAAFAIGTSAAEPLVLSTSNTERLRITSAGLVGIGTSSPGATLHVEGLGNTVNQRIFTSDNVSNATASLTFGTTPGSRSKAAIRMININTGNAQGALSLLTDTGTSGLVDRLYIDGNGRVGIGTTSPASTLHINGTTTAYGNGAASLFWGNTSTLGSLTYSGTTAIIQQITTADGLAFWRGTTEQARIDSSGRLLVGTSTSVTGINQPQYAKLQVIGNTLSGARAGLIALGRSEDASTIVAGEQLGGITFGDNAAGEFAYIFGEADGTAGANDYPGRLVFSTTADGASSPTERLRINNVGQTMVNSAGTVAAPVISKVDDPDTGIYFPTANTIAFAEGGSEAARIDSDGRFAVGTTGAYSQVTLRADPSVRPQFSLGASDVNLADGYFVFHTKAAKNSTTFTCTITWGSQSAQYCNNIIEVIFSGVAAGNGSGNTTAGGRAMYTARTLTSVDEVNEIEDIGDNVSFAAVASGMTLAITATTTAAVNMTNQAWTIRITTDAGRQFVTVARPVSVALS